jgi:hypothetical protein
MSSSMEILEKLLNEQVFVNKVVSSLKEQNNDDKRILVIVQDQDEQNVDGEKKIFEQFKLHLAPLSSTHIETSTQSKLLASSSSTSTFDCIIICISNNTLSSTLIEHCLKKCLKTKASLFLCSGANNENKEVNHYENELKLNGFTNVNVMTTMSSESKQQIRVVNGEKPHFEIGSSSKLKFKSNGNHQTTTTTTATAKVWQLNDNDDDDDDLINTDDLLDVNDMKKPVKLGEQMFDCGESAEDNATTKKKKACKNCSCGLAEQIETDLIEEKKKEQTTTTKTSSCGSCYLGDAFRCASCPYAGMPAFKPGEKVTLNANLLKADI